MWVIASRRHAQEVDDQRADDSGRQRAAAVEEAVGEPALAEDAEVQVDDGERAVAVDLAGERLDRQLQRQQRQLQGSSGRSSVPSASRTIWAAATSFGRGRHSAEGAPS